MTGHVVLARNGFLLSALLIIGVAPVPTGAALPTALGAAQPAEGAAATVPFQVHDNRVFVDVQVNGSDPLRFVFDTGGSYVVNAPTAETLNLPRGESLSLGGGGPDERTVYRTRLASVTIGDVVERDSQAFIIDLEPIRRGIGFERLDGIIGAELLAEYVAELNYEAQMLRLWPHADFAYDGPGTVVPFEFYGSIPLVHARIDGWPARLAVDTGDRSCLTLNKPFVSEHGLLDRYQWSDVKVTGVGIGGKIHGRTAAVEVVELGGLAVRGAVARLPVGDAGVFESTDFDGTVGNGMLRAQRVYVDYRERRLIIEDAGEPRCPGPITG